MALKEIYRTIGFSSTKLGEADVNLLVNILPKLEGKFDRLNDKGEFEFTYDDVVVTLGITELTHLSRAYTITMDDDFIEVRV